MPANIPTIKGIGSSMKWFYGHALSYKIPANLNPRYPNV